MKCDDCQAPINVRGQGWWREVQGWTQQRAAGGANAVSLAVLTGRYRCKWCMEQRRMKASQQLALFPDNPEASDA